MTKSDNRPNVEYNRKNQYSEIILNRGKNNPLDLVTLQDLRESFEKSSKNLDKCVLFKARGSNFTVGADLKYIRSLITARNYDEFETFSEAFQSVTEVMLAHPGIIIMGLHGWVIGGGFEMSLSADLRIASKDTKIKLPELTIGTIFSNASTKLLPLIVGLGRAKEMMLLGQEISSSRGYEIGLLNKVCERSELDKCLKDTALQIAKNIDSNALAKAKELIHTNIDESFSEVLDNELVAMKALSDNNTFLESIESFAK